MTTNIHTYNLYDHPILALQVKQALVDLINKLLGQKKHCTVKFHCRNCKIYVERKYFCMLPETPLVKRLLCEQCDDKHDPLAADKSLCSGNGGLKINTDVSFHTTINSTPHFTYKSVGALAINFCQIDIPIAHKTADHTVIHVEHKNIYMQAKRKSSRKESTKRETKIHYNLLQLH